MGSEGAKCYNENDLSQSSPKTSFSTWTPMDTKTTIFKGQCSLKNGSEKSVLAEEAWKSEWAKGPPP